jgi:ATP-dependent Clp protease protease subunit
MQGGKQVAYVFEESPRGDRIVDIYSRLLKDRIVFLSGEVHAEKADLLVAQMFYLESLDPKRDIILYINSPGGEVTAGLAIYDAMEYVSCDVCTICIGEAASMGALLLAAGAHGKRAALPSARIMIHQPLGGAQGQASDLAIHVNEVLRVKNLINTILAERTGKPFDIIESDTERDRFLTAQAALDYGLIDRVISRRPDVGG